jgi:hypothetical protein
VSRRLRALSFLVAAIALAGCGKSEEEKYADDFKPVNDRLLKVGERIGTRLGDASKQTNARLARQFGGFASDLEKVNGEIAALDPPKDLRDESRTLTERIEVVVKDLEDISEAARSGDPKAAKRAALSFGRHSPPLNQAQNRLARATGADPGTR